MKTWLYLRGGPADAPRDVALVVDTLEREAHTLRATEGSDGGLKRPQLREAVVQSMAGLVHRGSCSTSPFGKEELDFVLAGRKLAISVQAGRAWSNNGALLALLGAAADPGIQWLVIAVPFVYKTGAQYAPVAGQVTDLLAAGGVDLDLAGVALVAY